MNRQIAQIRKLTKLLVIAIAAASLQACGALAGGTVNSAPTQQPALVLHDDSVQLEIAVARGGAITYLNILAGVETSGNIVDNGDLTGRSIQAALYDGHWGPDCWPCRSTCTWGNNPVQEGDACQRLSGGQLVSQTPTAIVTSTTPQQWNSALGVSKVALEQTTTIVAPGVVRVDYKVTNHDVVTIGADNWHELPVAYVSPEFELGTYVDVAGAVQHTATSRFVLHAGAAWVALSTAAGWTVALYAPEDHPWSIGFGGGNKPTSFLQAWQWLELAPEETGTSTAWLVIGRSLEQVQSRIAALLTTKGQW